MSGGSFKDLKVYQKAYKLAMEIYNISKIFPKEEVYALTDQIRRSSRSICANIAEAYRKRRYVKYFVSKLTDADGEASETLVWLDFARDAGYISVDVYQALADGYRDVGRMLGTMVIHPERFLPKEGRVSEDEFTYGLEDE